ncbi:MAG TPA: Imm1 family immunity protein [Pyrinomonadaceae bacterium]|nr:Imm1 family immunity protein [Pyrinomonadaceae bacterium]
MSQIEATVSWWSHDLEAVKVGSVAELDHLIDGVIKSECSQYPTVLEIEVQGCRLMMAVGLPESFVQITTNSSVTVATIDGIREGTFDFYFQGIHHTEIRRRHILPIATARELARAFLITGVAPDGITWEEL